MKNLNNIKSITGKVTFNGIGSINNDSNFQKNALSELGFKVNGAKSDFYGNVTYHKKEFFKENGKNKFRYKVSHDCIRHVMFNEEMPYYNGGLILLPQVLYNGITSPTMIARGYMFTENDLNIKKKSAFCISDALSKDVCDKIVVETCSRAGERGEEKTYEITDKNGETKIITEGATSLFARENVGEHEYEATFGIDLTELQFISLDDFYGRKSANVDTKELLELYTSCMKRNFETSEEIEKKPYYLKTSIMGEECAEEGVLLTQKMANKVVHTILNKLIKTKIERPSQGGFFNFKKAELTINFADGSEEEITITSDKDFNDIFFGYEQVYFEADEERIKKRDSEIKRIEEDMEKREKMEKEAKKAENATKKKTKKNQEKESE